MRRKDRKIDDKELINKMLTESNICRIALHDDEYPYVVPMNYGYSNNCIYMHCAATGKKIDLLKRNNKVCFEIEVGSELIKSDISCKWTTKYRSIIGYGTIEIITDSHQKIEGLDVIMKHHGKSDNIYESKVLNMVTILKLTISDLDAKQAGDW